MLLELGAVVLDALHGFQLDFGEGTVEAFGDQLQDHFAVVGLDLRAELVGEVAEDGDHVVQDSWVGGL